MSSMSNEDLLKEIECLVDTKIKGAIQEIRPELLTVEDVCDIIGISKKTFHNWQKDFPMFTFVQYKQTKRIPRSSLDQWLKEHRTQGEY